MKRKRPIGILAVCLAQALLYTALYSSPVIAETGLTNRLLLGYDSFIDRFTLVEDDTTETIHEYYTGMDNNLLLSRDGTRFTLRNVFKYGNQIFDDNLDAGLTAGSRKRGILQLRGNLHVNHFQEGSDYEFGNDYIQSNLNLNLGKNVRESVYVSVKTRAELVDFQDRTEFDYDYYYFDAGVGAEAGGYFGKYVRAIATLGHREAPDTTALNFDRILSEIETRLTSGEKTFDLSVTGDRREYELDYTDSTRSDYWMVFSTTGLTWTRPGGSAVTLRLESELTYFDTESETWFNNHFVRGSLKLRLPLSTQVNFFAEPRLARMLCSSFPEERYYETSIILGLDIPGNEKYWFSLSYEPGYRSYTLEDNPIYSDFMIGRLFMMGTVVFGGRYSANLFLSHDPEKHKRRTDDFTVTMFSVSLAASF